MKKLSFIIAVAMIFTMLMPTNAFAETVSVQNVRYFQDFENISSLADIGFTDGNGTAIANYSLTSTAEKGNGLAASTSSALQSYLPQVQYNGNAMIIDASAFENAGKTLEYGADIYIPAGQVTAHLHAQLMTTGGAFIQSFSKTAGVQSGYYLIPKGTVTGGAAWATTSIPNGNITWTDYDETAALGWVNFKAKVTYEADIENGTGYYVTETFINNVSKGTVKIQQATVPSNGRYLRFGVFLKNADAEGVVVLDNLYATISRSENIANKSYFQDFENAESLDALNWNYKSRFEIATTPLNGQGISEAAPASGDTQTTIGFSDGWVMNDATKARFQVDAAYFENAGKDFEASIDYFVPSGAVTGAYAYEFVGFTGGQNFTYLPRIEVNSSKQVEIKVMNGEGSGDANSNTALMSSTGIKKDIGTDGIWINVKSRVSYVNEGEKGYYITRYYVDGILVEDFSLKLDAAELSSATRYMRANLAINNKTTYTVEIVADNASMKLIDAENKVDVELTRTDNAATCEYINYGTAAKAYQMIVAGYDGDGKLVNVDISAKGSFAAKSTGSVSATLSTAATTYKAFLWESLASGKPIVDAK